MPTRGSVVLTGNAQVGIVLDGKTFYSNDPNVKRTGTVGFDALTYALFRTNAATGDCTLPARVNDNDTVAVAVFTINEYASVALTKALKFNKFSIYGHADMDEDGTFKVQIQDPETELWSDWITGIPTNKATWAEHVGEDVIAIGVRIIATLIDTKGSNYIGECKVEWV